MQISQLRSHTTNNNQNKDNTPFKGIGSSILASSGKFFQLCDDVPMIGVSFTDTVATNVPRTIVDYQTAGMPAASETARREFSGLIVNCLIPGAFVWGAAKAVNNGYMKDFVTEKGKPLSMSGSWANGEAISNLTGVWSKFAGITKDASLLQGAEKDAVIQKSKQFTAKGFIKSALSGIEGLSGNGNWQKLSEHKPLIEKVAEILQPVIDKERPEGIIERFKFGREKDAAVKKAYEVIVNGISTNGAQEAGHAAFRAVQTLKFNGQNIGSDLRNFLRDATDIGSALKHSENARLNPNDFIKKASQMVNTKSLIGLGTVIPLAASMQYINRAITRHKYNKTGAPIYKDFEKEDNRVLTDEEKKQLKIQKPLAVASIIGLAGLSMGKTFPKNLSQFKEMLQFNTKFPSLNQCRLIATATFASRMVASEDPNELRESTVRDLASFAGLYFLGDYAEKLAATGIQKFAKDKNGNKIEMFNYTKDPNEQKGVIEKLKHWIKDTNIKSFDEINPEHKNYRSLAKIGGLAFSIALLGVFLPKYNRYVTNKKEEKRKAEMLSGAQQAIDKNNWSTEKVKSTSALKGIGMEAKNSSDMTQESAYLYFQSTKYINNPAFSKVASQFSRTK